MILLYMANNHGLNMALRLDIVTSTGYQALSMLLSNYHRRYEVGLYLSIYHIWKEIRKSSTVFFRPIAAALETRFSTLSSLVTSRYPFHCITHHTFKLEWEPAKKTVNSVDFMSMVHLVSRPKYTETGDDNSTWQILHVSSSTVRHFHTERRAADWKEIDRESDKESYGRILYPTHNMHIRSMQLSLEHSFAISMSTSR